MVFLLQFQEYEYKIESMEDPSQFLNVTAEDNNMACYNGTWQEFTS